MLRAQPIVTAAIPGQEFLGCGRKQTERTMRSNQSVLSALSWSLPPFQPLVPTRTSLSDRDGDMWAEINSISSQSWRRSWSFITAIDGLTKTKVTLMGWKIRMSKWTSTGPVLHNRDHSRKACANWQCDSKICLGIRKAKGSLDVCVADIHPEKQTLSMVKGMMGAINLL